ncbi:MAG: hypothetical protein KKE59_04110 [Proteobacteria bacterium]|nr:hypothetical protein [Pseudomonadota bacterium]
MQEQRHADGANQDRQAGRTAPGSSPYFLRWASLAAIASGFWDTSLGPVAYTPSAYFPATLIKVSSLTPSNPYTNFYNSMAMSSQLKEFGVIIFKNILLFD